MSDSNRHLPLSLNVDDVRDATVISASSKIMGGGATASVFGWLASSDGMAAIGSVIAILGFILNAAFQYRRDKRDHLLHKAQMERLEKDT